MTNHDLRSRLPGLSERLSLGDSGLQVSPICLGLVSDPRVIPEAFDRGINFFFVTADMHWPLYEETRRGLAELFRRGPATRDRVVVAAVSYVAQPEFATHPFLEVIESVPGLSRIDLTLVGGVSGREDARFASFARHASEQRVPGVRAFGATFHARAEAALRVSRGDVAIGYVRYNANHSGAERDVFPGPHPPRA